MEKYFDLGRAYYTYLKSSTIYMMVTKKIQMDLSLFVTETFQFMDINCQI